MEEKSTHYSPVTSPTRSLALSANIVRPGRMQRWRRDIGMRRRVEAVNVWTYLVNNERGAFAELILLTINLTLGGTPS